MKKKVLILILLVIVIATTLSGCQGVNGKTAAELKASGIISAREINIAPQISGTVVSVNVQEGDEVKKGSVLFQLDDALLQAQRNQADAAVKLAEEALNSARTQYDMAVYNARQQDKENRINSWKASQPSQFELPVWYFDKVEKLASAESEMDAASDNLNKEKENLQNILNNSSSQDFLTAEKSLADKQAAFLIADQVLSQANGAQDKEDLYNYADNLYSVAETELISAQSNYNRLLTTQAARDVLEARARVRVAQERLDRAIDYYNSLKSGDQSLQVEAADNGVKQAEAALAQAQAALAAIDVQLEKTIITAPVDGIVLNQNLEEGEMLLAAGVALTIGQLQEVNLIVYIPETEYGRIKLGDTVTIAVDSFPGKDFSGTVTNISDEAEFTPRNVQTVDGRKTTVFAVKITVPNPDIDLKPGMPADVTFIAK